jgi:hypothetical protein
MTSVIVTLFGQTITTQTSPHAVEWLHADVSIACLRSLKLNGLLMSPDVPGLQRALVFLQGVEMDRDWSTHVANYSWRCDIVDSTRN